MKDYRTGELQKIYRKLANGTITKTEYEQILILTGIKWVDGG